MITDDNHQCYARLCGIVGGGETGRRAQAAQGRCPGPRRELAPHTHAEREATGDLGRGEKEGLLGGASGRDRGR